MGRASRAKKLKQALVRQKMAVELVPNLTLSHRQMVEALCDIPEFVAMLTKIDGLPPTNYFLSLWHKPV